MERIVVVGKTIDEAIRNGLSQLGLTEDQVQVRVLEQPSKGLFGLIGSKDAKVELERIQVAVQSRALSDSDAVQFSRSTPEDAESVEPAIRFLNEVFQAMDIQVEMSKNYENEHWIINLTGDEIGILIGRRGQTLDSLQYLTNIVYNRHVKSHTKIILDAENFRDRRRQTLEELSERLARKVVKTRKEVVLEPMSPQERKIIHSTLQDHRYVKTYSKGEDPNRRVVIALK